jgi:hypothetical protein
MMSEEDPDWRGLLGADDPPDAGFTGRVLGALPPRRGRRRPWVLLGAAAAGAALGLPPACAGLAAAGRALGAHVAHLAQPGPAWAAALAVAALVLLGVARPVAGD